MLSGFRDFLLRGNVVDLAVAVVIGAAFGAVTTGIVEGLLNPLVAAVVGETDLSRVGAFTVGQAEFRPGLVIDALLRFTLTAAAIYVLVVVPVRRLLELRQQHEVPEVATTPEDVALLQEIRDLLRERPGA